MKLSFCIQCYIITFIGTLFLQVTIYGLCNPCLHSYFVTDLSNYVFRLGGGDIYHSMSIQPFSVPSCCFGGGVVYFELFHVHQSGL